MSAMFRWSANPTSKSPAVGDRKTVTRFLLWPKLLEGEWRWLGFETIVQEFQRYRVQPPEMRAMDVVGWRDKAWASEDGLMEGRQRSQVKRCGSNGPPTYPRPAPPPPPPPPPRPRVAA